jgi:YVTN family beta-propeller protein
MQIALLASACTWNLEPANAKPAEVPMNMANFLMPENAPEADVIDGAPLDGEATRIGVVDVRRGPIADIATSDDGTLVVTNHGDDTVSLLNPRTLAVASAVAVAGEPFAVVVADGRAYVSTSSAGGDAVSVIDTAAATVVATYSLAFSVTALAASPDGKRVYAARTGDGHADIAVIDTTAERVGTIDIATGAGIGIDAVQVDPTGKRLYVAITDAAGSALVIVDAETAKVQRTVPIDAPIRDLAIVDGSAYVLVSDRARGGAVAVLNLSTGRITGTAELGIGAPTQMTVSADGARAYIVDYDNVTVLCTRSLEIVNKLKVDARPSCVAVDSAAGHLYVADYAGEVTALSVASAMPLLFEEFMATDPIYLPIAQREPVSA